MYTEGEVDEATKEEFVIAIRDSIESGDLVDFLDDRIVGITWRDVGTDPLPSSSDTPTSGPSSSPEEAPSNVPTSSPSIFSHGSQPSVEPSVSPNSNMTIQSVEPSQAPVDPPNVNRISAAETTSYLSPMISAVLLFTLLF